MTAPTKISLEPETRRRAEQRAARLGISVAEYVRRLLERELGEHRERADPSLVFDLGDSGGSDVARKKDSMLGEAIAAESLREHSAR
jgi:hypothetical protein